MDISGLVNEVPPRQGSPCGWNSVRFHLEEEIRRAPDTYYIQSGYCVLFTLCH